MKSILISIKPKWVEKILNGEKTIEIRKSMPKCELPCKVYIYCTSHNNYKDSLYLANDGKYDVDNYVPSEKDFILNGKVVAEFTLNKVEEFEVWSDLWLISKQVKEELENIRKNSCLSQAELLGYLGRKHGYAWYIDDLIIYDKPKELDDFSVYIPNNKCEKHEQGFDCEKCNYYIKQYRTCGSCYYLYRKLKRPPQSWCYVEGE